MRPHANPPARDDGCKAYRVRSSEGGARFQLSKRNVSSFGRVHSRHAPRAGRLAFRRALDLREGLAPKTPARAVQPLAVGTPPREPKARLADGLSSAAAPRPAEPHRSCATDCLLRPDNELEVKEREGVIGSDGCAPSLRRLSSRQSNDLPYDLTAPLPRDVLRPANGTHQPLGASVTLQPTWRRKPHWL